MKTGQEAQRMENTVEREGIGILKKQQQKVAGGRGRREGRLWAATVFPLTDCSSSTCGKQKGSAGLGSHRPGFRLFVTA